MIDLIKHYLDSYEVITKDFNETVKTKNYKLIESSLSYLSGVAHNELNRDDDSGYDSFFDDMATIHSYYRMAERLKKHIETLEIIELKKSILWIEEIDDIILSYKTIKKEWYQDSINEHKRQIENLQKKIEKLN